MARMGGKHVRPLLLIAEAVMVVSVVIGTRLPFLSLPPARAQAGAPEENTPSSIPLAEVAGEAEAASARLRELRAEIESDAATETIAKQIAPLAREIDARSSESRKIIAQRPALEILDTLEADWRRVRRTVSRSAREMNTRLVGLDHDGSELEELAKTWNQTQQSAQESKAPSEVLKRIESVVAEITQVRERAQQQRSRTLTTQSRLAAQDARIADALASISRARDNLLGQLFNQDSTPIWTAGSVENRGKILQESSGSLFRQRDALTLYSDREAAAFFLHVIFFCALAAVFYFARERTRRLQNSGLWPSPAAVLERPIAAALLMASLSIPWLYPEAPRLLWAIFGLFALMPSVILLRCRTQRDFHPIFYALLLFYVLDQIRTLTAAVPVLPRALFLAELLGATGFWLWMLRRLSEPVASDAHFSPKTLRIVFWTAFAVSGSAFGANAMGFVLLGNLLGNALLRSSYFALILWALIEVLDALAGLLLRFQPVYSLSAVRRYNALLQERIRIALWWLGGIAWIVFVFGKLLLRERLFTAIEVLLAARLSVGSIHLSFGDVLAFAVTVWAAFLFSRLVRFLLDEEVYPRLPLAPGLPYAISTMVHYVILFAGFVAAVAVLGIDMTKVTILAGAFSVGVGLGLQNIFNNFVSGIILLFERPVKVGDIVQIEDASGVVEHIGIRASIIRTIEGSEIIVPNGKLISERVTNWTLTNRQHTIQLPVAVAPGADPGKVATLLEHAATSHPLIAKDPAPQALVVKLGPDALGLELRAWTDRLEQWMQIRSELAISVSSALAAENIALR